MSAFPPLRDVPALIGCYAITAFLGWLVWPAACALVRDLQTFIGA